MRLKGMDSIKRQFLGMHSFSYSSRLIFAKDLTHYGLGIYDHWILDKERKIAAKPVLNVRLEGNPGTGKTTVARLYARLFAEFGIGAHKYFMYVLSKPLMFHKGLPALVPKYHLA